MNLLTRLFKPHTAILEETIRVQDDTITASATEIRELTEKLDRARAFIEKTSAISEKQTKTITDQKEEISRLQRGLDSLAEATADIQRERNHWMHQADEANAQVARLDGLFKETSAIKVELNRQREEEQNLKRDWVHKHDLLQDAIHRAAAILNESVA